MEVIYHYCNINAFFGIIKNKNIWLNDAFKTNDSLEMQYSLEIMVKLFNEIEKDIELGFFNKFKNYYKNQISTIFNPHIACFSKEEDILSQWRSYADNGRGVAIGFNNKYFKENKNLINKEIEIKNIVYDFDKQYNLIHDSIMHDIGPSIIEISKTKSIDYLIDNFDMNILAEIFKYGLFFKHDSFKEEKEVRIIHGTSELMAESDMFKYRPINNDLISYLEFPLDFDKSEKPISEIIIGPKCKLEELKINDFLVKNGINPCDINIKKSKSTYR